jgi:hypothetical protein
VVEITPVDAVSGDELTCTVVTESNDADGDAITYTFAWDVDGVDYTGATDSALDSVVDGADVGGGETWTCEVVAGDGDDTALAATASVDVRGCYALAFDGYDDYAVTATTGMSYGTSYTVEAWIYRDSSLARGGYDLFLTHGWTPTAWAFQWAEAESRIAWSYLPSSSWTSLGTASLPSTDSWHHVAGVFSPAGATLYIDGTLSSSTTGTSTPGSLAVAEAIHIGGMAPSACSTCQTDYAFGGQIGPMRVSTSARYAASFVPAWGWSDDPNTLALWNLEEGGGTVLVDSSASGLDATIYGASWRSVTCP